ncbi:hypothetical protein [Lactococcus lactis]
MFNSKKFFTLCATSIAGFSAVASIAPVSVFADAAKNGDTVVTYDGTPQPAEWGLSVPATIKLDKITDSGQTAWGSEKLEIVKDDGSTFSDTSKDRTFTISGTPKNLTEANRFTLHGENNLAINTMMNALPQGEGEPTEWRKASAGSNMTLDKATFDIISKSDGSTTPSRYWVVGIHDGAGLKPVNYSNTMAWTATEK